MKQMISLESSPQKRNFLVIESLQVGHVWVCVPHWFYFTLHSLTWAHSAPNFSTNFLRFLAAASRIAYTKHTRQEQNINIDNSERRISSPLSRHLALVCTCLLYMFYTVLLVRETLIHQGYCPSPSSLQYDPVICWYFMYMGLMSLEALWNYLSQEHEILNFSMWRIIRYLLRSLQLPDNSKTRKYTFIAVTWWGRVVLRPWLISLVKVIKMAEQQSITIIYKWHT